MRVEIYSKRKPGEVAWLIRVDWCARVSFFHTVETGATDVMLESCQCCSNFYFKEQCSTYIERLSHAFSSLRALAAWVFVICFRGQANSWNGLNNSNRLTWFDFIVVVEVSVVWWIREKSGICLFNETIFEVRANE